MAQKPRVLFVLPADIVGGVELRTQRLLRGMQHLQPILLTQRALAARYEELGVELYFFDDYQCQQPYAYTPGNALRYARCIARVAKAARVQLVFAFMHNGTVFLTLARDLFGLRVPAVGSIFGHLSGYFTNVGRAATGYERWLIRHCTRRLQSTVVCAHSIAQDLAEQYGAPSTKLSVIANGSDLERLRQRAQQTPPLEKHTPWIVTVCRLDVQKDVGTLLRALALLPEPTRLLVVGEGPLLAQLQAQAQQLGVAERVEWLGFQENPLMWVARAEVFVLSSFYEGSANVLVEAMAVGTPVVTSDCPGGSAEIIQHQDSGYLFPVGDAQQLAEYCQRLLDDARLRAELSHAALRRAEQQFSLPVMVQAYEQHLLQQLNGGR